MSERLPGNEAELLHRVNIELVLVVSKVLIIHFGTDFLICCFILISNI